MRSLNHYILDDNKNVVPVDLKEWAKSFEEKNRRVAQTDVTFPNGEKFWVSTVFLGLDHYFGDDPNHAPVVFETMVFAHPKWFKEEGLSDLYSERCCTYAEALEMHERAVAWAKTEALKAFTAEQKREAERRHEIGTESESDVDKNV